MAKRSPCAPEEQIQPPWSFHFNTRFRMHNRSKYHTLQILRCLVAWWLQTANNEPNLVISWNHKMTIYSLKWSAALTVEQSGIWNLNCIKTNAWFLLVCLRLVKQFLLLGRIFLEYLTSHRAPKELALTPSRALYGESTRHSMAPTRKIHSLLLKHLFHALQLTKFLSRSN